MDVFSFSKPVLLFIGDAGKILKKLPSSIVDTVITSPPYYRQRFYGHPEEIGQEESVEEYVENLKEVFREVKRVLKKTGVVFLNIGDKYIEKRLQMVPERVALALIEDGWVLVNKIIWQKPNAMPSPFKRRLNNIYEPVYVFVKEEGLPVYYFNVDAVREKPKYGYLQRSIAELIGMEVVDNIREDKAKKGWLKGIDEEKGVGLVEWEDGREELLRLNPTDEENEQELVFLCPRCGEECEEVYGEEIQWLCSSHGYFPKDGEFPIPQYPTEKEIAFSYGELFRNRPTLFPTLFERSYNGKYLLSPENRGASPGARLSLQGEKLIVRRRYVIYQSLVADFLKYWKNKRGITIKEIDKYFGYRDTAGHWLRKDSGRWGKGGSVPSPNDWDKLKELLGFPDIYDKWIKELHLTLQTVRPHPKGRNPGDVWSINLQPLSLPHFAPFPEELVERCIKLGCPPNGVVLDPFAGSGTVGKVAKEMGRKAILIEIVKEYANLILQRCENECEVIEGERVEQG
ncbi:site-specific DNA-methyltransferase [bacterium]|nr:site-specific DNA-methyltransferase [bacterium]